MDANQGRQSWEFGGLDPQILDSSRGSAISTHDESA